MINLYEAKDFLSEENINFINKTVWGSKFAFYLNEKATDEEDFHPWFGHAVLVRPEDRKSKNQINSFFLPYFVDMFTNLLKKCGYPKQKIEITRCNVNYSYNTGHVKESGIHRDQDGKVKIAIIYLNDADQESKTNIYTPDQKTILYSVTPEKYKGVIFDDFPHNNICPTYGERLVVVYNFIELE